MFKYPRTFHLPWSKGKSSDDKTLENTNMFEGKGVIVTEKMDGENTTMGPDYIHARSLDSKHHFSRDWIKSLHAQIKYKIPHGWRICGENLWAEHSIRYEDLQSYFYPFAVYDSQNYCLDWEEMGSFLYSLNNEYIRRTPRVFWCGKFDEEKIRAIQIDEKKCEGYVVRNSKGFYYEDFGVNVAKYVRAGHVQTDEHWSRNAKQNGPLIK